eukprot:5648970-Amphidinium_carterae.1
MEKAASLYTPSMLTYPRDQVACCVCQKLARGATDRYSRTSWFTCQHCHELIWTETAPSAIHVRHCLNCSNRTTRVPDQHTCRSCGVRWFERQANAIKRQRLCPKCRT